jgi:hypothetical protein
MSKNCCLVAQDGGEVGLGGETDGEEDSQNESNDFGRNLDDDDIYVKT